MKNIKSVDFYEKVIIHHKTHLNETESFFNNFSGVYTKTGLISKLSIFGTRLNILLASYSKGDDKDNLRQQFSEAVKVMEQVWDKRITKVYHGQGQVEYDQYKLNSYIHILQMFSLAVLLEVPKNEFQILVDLIDRDGIKDRLIEFMISSRYPKRSEIKEESYQRYMMIPKLYKKLVDIAYNLEFDRAILETDNFLKKEWIKIPKKYYINLNLKDIPKYEVKSGFVGFWTFEVAAVVKIKALDDSSFRDNRFYPNRLV